MALLYSRCEVARPVRPDDYQVQKSSLYDTVPEMIRLAVFEARRDDPSRTFNGYLLEVVADGAGVSHYNLTVYFMHESPLPSLDHRNLNGAEQAVFGQVLKDEDFSRLSLGLKDTRL